MKKSIIPAIILCSIILSGCYDDDYYEESETTAISQLETDTYESIIPITEGISNEGTTIEESSDMMPPTTDAPETWAEEETDAPDKTEYSEELETSESTEPTETTSAETTAETSTEMTETPSAELTAPAETEQITEAETTEPTTESVTEPETISAEPEQSDYDKAWEVYEYMLANGHGTCVNYACQTYDKCQEIGFPCYIVWTDDKLYAHVANTVQVEGIWFIMDTQAGRFLTFNPGFTEVVDRDESHIGDAEMLSNYSYDEMFG